MDAAQIAISIKRVPVFRGGVKLNDSRHDHRWEAKVTLHREDGASSEIVFEDENRLTVVKRTTQWLAEVL